MIFQRFHSAALLFLLVLGGCAGYQVGPTNGMEAGSRSVEIQAFRNDTLEPRVVEPLMTALRRRVQQDGTYRLETRESGDVVVSGVLTDFHRSKLSHQPGDIITARDYRLALAARVKGLDRTTGKVLFDRMVSGRTSIRVGSDLGSAERQAMPLLADDLARNIASLLVDGVW